MDEKLKILLLEDSADDAELVQRLLKKERPDCEFSVAMSKDKFLQELDAYKPDLILADNSMPQFSSADALEIVRHRDELVPFILITGTVSEEFAAKIIKQGADDYFLKDRLTRLPSAIDSALKQRRLEKEKLESQLGLKAAHERLLFHVENAPLGFIEFDDKLEIKTWSKRAEEMFGFTEAEVKELRRKGISHVYEDDRPMISNVGRQLLSGEVKRNSIQHRSYRKDGTVIWCEWFNSVLTDEQGNVITIMSLVMDITSRVEAEEARKQAEIQKEFDSNNLKALINNTNDLMWSIDRDYNLITSNNAFNKIYRADVKRHLPLDNSEALPQEQLRKFQKYYDRALAGETFSEVVYSSSPVESWSEISLYPIRTGNEVIGTACYARDVTERIKASQALHHMEQEILNQKVQEQKKITRAILNAQEKERNHIGQELHDNINQILAGAKLYLSVAGKRNEPLKESIAYPMELIDKAMHEIRLLSSHQVTPIKNVDLEETVQLLLDSLQETSSIKTKLIYKMEAAINDDIKLNIYRITQELVNNIIKHAAATSITVTIENENEHINLTVKDDGRGFDIYKKRTGVGISNMINRIESFNGKILIESSPGSGCQVEVSIPYQLS